MPSRRPAGWIMISRGMLRCCKSEDALQPCWRTKRRVQNRHGLQAIKKGRPTAALTTLARGRRQIIRRRQSRGIGRAFENSIADITATLMNSGYSRAFERQADQAAVSILKRSGYDPQALVEMLEEMQKHLQPGGRDFARTHPAPESRIADIRKLIGSHRAPPAPPARQARFARYMQSLP